MPDQAPGAAYNRAARRRETARQMVDLLERLAAVNPEITVQTGYDTDRLGCKFCAADLSPSLGETDLTHHFADCLWRQTREWLERRGRA